MSAATSTARSTTWPTSPFEQAFPWSGQWDDVPAARAAALGFELLTALALFGLGPAAPSGPGGERRSASPSPTPGSPIPFTMYTLGSSFNDALVALLVVCCLLVALLAPGPGRAVGARGAHQVRPADPGAAVRRRPRGAAGPAADPLRGSPSSPRRRW